jgi:hypothetical protein
MNAINIINTSLCAIILVLGCWGFKKKTDNVPLFIGVAFGLFGISHIVASLGLSDIFEIFLVMIRVLAYLIVIFALYRDVTREED